jgi:hypothetical protein
MATRFKSKILSSILVSVFILFCEITIADVLFVDLNFNSKEVATARQAVEGGRKETLIIIPKFSNNPVEDQRIRAQAGAIKERIEKASDEMRCTDADQAKKDLKALMTTHNLMAQIDEKMEYRKELDKSLAEISKSGKPLTSMIISGHHGGKSFSGAIGHLSEHDLPLVFKKYKQVGQGVASIYLWGCYTAPIPQVRYWKTVLKDGKDLKTGAPTAEGVIFPNLKVLAGFSAIAPKEDKAFNHTFLKEMLVKEQQASTVADLSAFFRTMGNNGGATAVIARFCDRNGTYATPTKSISLKDAFLCKQADKDEFENKLLPIFQKYMDAKEKGYENVPPESTHSTLRKIYSRGRALLRCYDTEETLPNSDSGSIFSQIDQKMLPLIRFRPLLANFEKSGKEILDEARSILKSQGKPLLLAPNFSNPKLTRAEVISQRNNLYYFLKDNETIVSSNSKKLNDHDRRVLQSVQNSMSTLNHLSFSTSLHMTEENTSLEKLRDGFRFPENSQNLKTDIAGTCF